MQRGFSLLQMLVVLAIVVAVAAIAVPRLLPAQQFAAEDAAVTTMRVALDDAVSRATAGATLRFRPAAVVGLPASVAVNAADYPAPEGATVPSEFDLRGGRGTPLVVPDGKYATAAAPGRVAIVLSDAGGAWADSLVLNTAGVVTEYQWRDKQWIAK